MRLGDAILLLYTAPIFGALFTKVSNNEHCGVVNFTAGFSSILGIFFTLQPHVFFSDMSHSADGEWVNCVFACGGAVSIGVCYVSVRALGATVSPLVSIFWINFLLLPTSATVQLILGFYSNPPCGRDRHWVLLSGVLMFISLYVLLRALSRDETTTPVILMKNLDVVVGYCYQVLWFEESIDILNIMGIIMIAGSVTAVFLFKLLKNVSVKTLRNIRYEHLEEETTDI